MSKQFTVLELFAGAGGLALGLEQAGLKNVGLVENDKSACSTLKINKPYWNVIERDITKIASIRDLVNDRIDLISGGFPCQSFSFAGKKLGLHDTRGTLFHDFARIVDEIKPKMVLLENVKGLLHHDKGKTFKVISSTFNDVGYNIEHKILNSNDFGVAEKRERMIIIGIRKDLPFNFKFPDPQDYKPCLRDVIYNISDDKQGYTYSENKKNVMKLVPPGKNWKSLPPLIAQDYMGKSYFSKAGGRTGTAKRLSWEGPSPTLTTSPNQKQTERCHPDETRPLTVKEYQLIQSFPENWKFMGSIANQYKPIGNAVPVNLSKIVGKQVIKSLESFIHK